MAAPYSQTDPSFDSSPLPYLFTVYTVTWLAFFAYAFYMSRRQRQLRQEIEELRRQLEEKKG